VLPQIFFFTQNLPMQEPETSGGINQENPVRKNKELANQDAAERQIRWITTEGEDPIRHKLIGLVRIYAHPEAFPKGHQGPQQ
jgi:hypothetical protein